MMEPFVHWYMSLIPTDQLFHLKYYEEQMNASIANAFLRSDKRKEPRGSKLSRTANALRHAGWLILS